MGIFDVETYVQQFLVYFCGLFTEWCQLGVGFVASSTIKPLNFSRLRAFFGHYPSASSLKCWQHWAQIYKSKRFQEFDYGPVMNERVYGHAKAPELDISIARDLGIPIALAVGFNDTIVFPEDSRWLRDQLSFAVKEYMEVEGGHLQYFIGNDVSYFYRLMKFMDRYRNRSYERV